MKLSEERLEEIEERCGKATEGPWAKYGIGGITSEEWDVAWEGRGLCPRCGGEVTQQPFVNPDDAEFCANARTDIPDLLSDRVELGEEIASLKAESERLRDLLCLVELLREAGREVLAMLPYHGLLDLPELRFAVEGKG